VSSPLTVDVGELGRHIGARLGPTPWRPVTQDEVDRFADLTEDHNYLHVDVPRAADSRFGGTIAHGFLTVSLLAALLPEMLVVTGAAVSVNYGLDRLRFPAPVLVGSSIRARGELSAVTDLERGTQAQVGVVVEAERSEKPALVADWLFRYYL
jgi:acyl dehydratase